LGRLLDHPAAIAITERADLAQAASHAFHGVFLLTACMGLVALTLTLRLPEDLSASTSRQTAA